MASRLFVAAFAAALVFVLAIGSSSSRVSAHEHRTVAENYEFVVGWNAEPAIGGQPNAVFLGITLFEGGVPEITEENEDQDFGGVPVEGANETLNVTVSTGGGADSIELPLEPAFGEAGAYESTSIIPAPGDYAFVFTGTLPDGTEVNETFETGPDTFDTVEDPAEIEFPAPTDAGSDSSTSESEDDDDGDSAMVIAIVAIIVAIIAAGVAIFAAARSRQT
jgi:hypothetical protein